MPNYNRAVCKRHRDVSRPPTTTLAYYNELRVSTIDRRVGAFKAKIKELNNA